MSASIAESRKNLTALIVAAQETPQIITKRNQPVAVLISTHYFERSQLFVEPVKRSFYENLLELRKTHALDDNAGFETSSRAASWKRPNPFAKR